MKITIMFKDPDAVSTALEDLEEEIRKELPEGLSTDEQDELIESRRKNYYNEVSEYFEYGEYAKFEYDTENKTMTLV